MPTCCPKVRDFATFWRKTPAEEPEGSFNLPDVDKSVTPQEAEPISNSRSSSYHTCSGDLPIDGTGDLETVECLVAAENALRHIREKEPDFAKVFKRWGIRKCQYALYAGFDEDAIQQCTGLLEQIHIITSARFLASNPFFLSQLGDVLIPFPGVLITRSFSYFFPAYKFNGKSWEIDTEGDTICHASDRGEGALRLPPVISMSKRHVHDTESGLSNSTLADDERKSEDFKADRASEHDHPLKERGPCQNDVPPGVSLHVTSKISVRNQDHSHKGLQRLTTDCALNITSKPDALHAYEPSPSRIQFTKLDFDNDRKFNTYKQFQVKVAVDFHERPSPTLKITPTFAVVEDSLEPVIIQRCFDGVTWWEYAVQDLYEQKKGVGMVDWMLPTLDFRKRNPGHIGIEIASYWSILMHGGSEDKWICDTLASVAGGSYSNFCQMVSLKVDPAKYKSHVDYQSKLAVDLNRRRCGSITQHNGSVQVFAVPDKT